MWFCSLREHMPSPSDGASCGEGIFPVDRSQLAASEISRTGSAAFKCPTLKISSLFNRSRLDTSGRKPKETAHFVNKTHWGRRCIAYFRNGRAKRSQSRAFLEMVQWKQSHMEKKEKPLQEVFLSTAAERSAVPPYHAAQWLGQVFHGISRVPQAESGSVWLQETELVARFQEEMALLKHRWERKQQHDFWP